MTLDKMNKCPKCGSIFILLGKVDDTELLKPLITVDFNGKIIYSLLEDKTEAVCDNIDTGDLESGCSQKFWYYPRTGRITRRNK